MLAGHYGVAYALRARWPARPLSHLFVAVQATDIAFSALAIALAGGYLCLRRSLGQPARRRGDLSFALLAVVEVIDTFQPAPSGVVSASIGAEVIYGVAILLALAIDRAVAHQHVLAIAGVQK